MKWNSFPKSLCCVTVLYASQGCGLIPATIYSSPKVQELLTKIPPGTSLSESLAAVGEPFAARVVALTPQKAKQMKGGWITEVPSSLQFLHSEVFSSDVALLLVYSKREKEGRPYSRLTARFVEGKLTNVDTKVDYSDVYGE